MQIRVIHDNLVFPECPRWRDNTLWFSDCHDGRVLNVSPDGQILDSFDVPGGPAGLGWLVDGDPLVVSIDNLCLYRRRPDGTLGLHADLSGHHRFHCNDMIVDRAGNAYVGEVGFRAGEVPRDTVLLLVRPDGSVSVAADNIQTPNGTAISPDGRTMIVAESRPCRLQAFSIAPDASLGDRHLFAQLSPDEIPDGICLDAEGCVWVASPRIRAALRVSPTGDVVERISTGDKRPYACVLGGADRRTLFLCLADTHVVAEARQLRGGQIAVVDVAIGGAGLP